MGRNAHFTNEQFIDAALKIASGQGPAAVTIAAIAGDIGAPIGSVYHRFPSRDVLLAEVWLRVVSSFQESFLQFLERGAGLEAALHTPRWVRRHPAEARIILLYRQEELVTGGWPEELKVKALELKRSLEGGIAGFTARTCGKSGRKEIDRAVFALIDMPYGAVIRHVREGRKPPKEIEDYIRQTYLTIMGER
jgi:AcrR family transcriptional regulator